MVVVVVLVLEEMSVFYNRKLIKKENVQLTEVEFNVPGFPAVGLQDANARTSTKLYG